MELRKSPRYKVRFRSSFSSPVLLAGEGIVLDLSVRGCRIACRMSVPRGTELELWLYLAEHGQEFPVAIPRAVVQWAERGELGVEFLQLSEGAPDHIRRCIRPGRNGQPITQSGVTRDFVADEQIASNSCFLPLTKYYDHKQGPSAFVHADGVARIPAFHVDLNYVLRIRLKGVQSSVRGSNMKRLLTGLITVLVVLAFSTTTTTIGQIKPATPPAPATPPPPAKEKERAEKEKDKDDEEDKDEQEGEKDKAKRKAEKEKERAEKKAEKEREKAEKRGKKEGKKHGRDRED